MLRMLPVLNASGTSLSSWVVTPKLYGDDWDNSKIDSAKLRLPAIGRLAAVAVIISPRPWLKSVWTLVCRCSYVTTLPNRMFARTRDVHIGWVRPWRKSSVRDQDSL